MVGSLPEGALAVSGGAVLTVEAPYLQGPFQVFHVRAAMLAGIAVLKNAGGVLWGVQLACLARDLQLPCCTMLAGGGDPNRLPQRDRSPWLCFSCAGHGAISGPQPALQHLSAGRRICRCGAAASCRCTACGRPRSCYCIQFAPAAAACDQCRISPLLPAVIAGTPTAASNRLIVVWDTQPPQASDAAMLQRCLSVAGGWPS